MDDNQIISYQLEQIKVQLGEIAEALESIGERTHKIERHLYNDNETDSDGIVKKVRLIDGRVKNLEDKEKVKDAKMGVWGMVGGAVLMVIYELLKYIFTPHK